MNETKRFMITASHDMSKDEEERVIDKLHEIFAVEFPGNYLSKLFSADFCAWVWKCIQDDTFPDAMEYVNDRDSYENLRAEFDEAKKIIDQQNSYIESLGREVEGWKSDAQRLLDQCSTEKQKRDELQDFLDCKEEMIEDYEDLLKSQSEELVCARSLLSAAEQENLKLKAKLYDYLEGEFNALVGKGGS